jgi:hypothetical protein
MGFLQEGSKFGGDEVGHLLRQIVAARQGMSADV